MEPDECGRRALLQGAMVSAAGLLPRMPAMAWGLDCEEIMHVAAGPAQFAAAAPEYSVKFAVCGMSHDHIYGMIGAMMRGGGELVSVYCAEPDRRATFVKRFPQAKVVSSEDEILN